MNPFFSLHQALNRLYDNTPFNAAGRLGAIVLLIILGGVAALLAFGVGLIAPASSLNLWLQENWHWLAGAAIVAFSVYGFCRNVMDVKTKD